MPRPGPFLARASGRAEIESEPSNDQPPEWSLGPASDVNTDSPRDGLNAHIHETVIFDAHTWRSNEIDCTLEGTVATGREM